jgi:hypothetical protein
MVRAVVWIAEDERHDDDGRILLGTFSGYLGGGDRVEETFEGLAVDAAIAWGRARAERVYIRLGSGEYHSAGADPARGRPRWPPPALPPLVERRPPGEAWKDRGASDEPIEWRAAVWLTPPWTIENPTAARASWEAALSEIAAATRADGWDGDEMEGFLEDLARARRENPSAASVGWASYHRPSYRVWFRERAATAALACDQASRRCSAPEGWKVEPGGAEPSAP